MKPRLSCSFAVLACLAIGGTALAQPAPTGSLPNGAMLVFDRMFLPDGEGGIIEPPDPEFLRFRMNLGACQCSLADQSATSPANLIYELRLAPTTNVNLPGKVFVGSDCQDPVIQDQNCTEIMNETAPIADLDALAATPVNIRVPLIEAISPKPPVVEPSNMCVQVNGGSAFVWVVADTDQNGEDDFFYPQPIHRNLFTDVTAFDTQPPPLVEDLSATGGENAISLDWDIPVSNATDLYAFQAFCMDAQGQAIANGNKKPLYSTSQTLCQIPANIELTPTVLATDEGTEVPTVPVEFAELRPEFLCGTQLSGTATNLTIEGLENGMEYKVALVAVDFYGNPTGTFFNRTIIPKPVTDFWEDIHDRGGKIEGGFCAAGGSDGALGLLLPLAIAGLIVRRRRRGITPRALAVAAVLVVPGIAAADDFTPYWEDPNTSKEHFGLFEDKVTWRAGIKIGPYTPAIDSQLGKNPASGMGPYQAMFGNYYTDENNDGVLEAHDARVYQILPMIDVDRVIWAGSGQLLVGGSLGYMQKSAFAYRDGTSPNDPFRVRSTAGKNTFRLIPFALTASYRATQLDDLWGIPLVPYLRGGLAYYVWWLKGPSGDISKICTDGSMDLDNCDSNRALGGSLGLVGTLGLSIRAERIDADAARSMKNGGIYHAGFYVELNSGVVNGFGSDKKLSVGDTTWFAGFDFEF